MKEFRIYYDEEDDILFLGKEGQEEEVIEIAPGLNLEMDPGGQIIGIELLRASTILKDVINPITRKAQTGW